MLTVRHLRMAELDDDRSRQLPGNFPFRHSRNVVNFGHPAVPGHYHYAASTNLVMVWAIILAYLRQRLRLTSGYKEAVAAEHRVILVLRATSQAARIAAEVHGSLPYRGNIMFWLVHERFRRVDKTHVTPRLSLCVGPEGNVSSVRLRLDTPSGYVEGARKLLRDRYAPW